MNARRALLGADRSARPGIQPALSRAAGVLLLAALVAVAGCAGPAKRDDPQAGETAAPQGDPDADNGGDATAEPAGQPEPAPEDTAEAAAREEAGREADEPRGLTGQNLYRLLVADLAGRKGDIGVALQGYLETARESRDPRVAERATRLALYAERPDAAMEAATRWASLAPDDRDAHSVLARLHLRDGDIDAATDEMRRVIGLSDSVADGLDRVTAIAGQSPDAEPALAAMERIAEDHPERAGAHYAVADLAASAGANARALESLERALELDPDYTEALVLRAQVKQQAGRSEAAIAELRQAYERYPEDRDLALGYVRLLINAGRVEAGRSTMERVHERFGGDARTVYSLALLAMQAELWTDARLYLERLVQMGERTDKAHYYLGRIGQEQGDCERALRHYIKVTGGEHRFDAGLRAAVCMGQVGRLEEARLHLERMRSRYQSESARVQITYTRAQVEREAGNPGRALEVLGNAVERYPDNLELRYSRALAAAREDRFELARSDLETILEREPDNARALNALGYMLADRGLELERARDMIQRALEQNPEDPATLDSMGWVLYRLGRNEQALEYLRRAWSGEKDPEIAAHLGEVLWVLGRREEARAIWRAGREQGDGDSGIVRETVERLTQ